MGGDLVASIDLPHFDLPFRFTGAGPAAVVEQDTDEDVHNCVQAIVRTPIGWRPYVPKFGIDDPTFEVQPVNIRHIEEQILESEPRARTLVSQDIDRFDQLVSNVLIEVSSRGNH